MGLLSWMEEAHTHSFIYKSRLLKGLIRYAHQAFPQSTHFYIHHAENRGVGAAMVTGFTQATKEYVFYTDGDAQYDLEELREFVPFAGQFEVIIGYRLSRAEGWTRVVTSRIFNFLMFLTFDLRFKDIDASFKLIHRSVLQKISFLTQGGLIDSELLIQIRDMGYPVKEIGVHHYPRKFGHSLCLRPKMVLSMLRDILHLRWLYWKKGGAGK